MIRPEGKIGDIFLVPIDEGRFVFGQIIDEYKATLLVAIFEGVFRRGIDTIAELKKRSPILLASTFDALLHNGSWPILGADLDSLRECERPEFLVGSNESCLVEDFHGRVMRKASAQDVEQLGYRNVVAPIRVQRATQAVNGVGEWQDSFDRLRVTEARRLI
jgi:hypothetical protein